MPLTTHQLALLFRNGRSPRRTVKFCNTCGGKHAGICNLVTTTHNTRCRPDILDAVERRFRGELAAK